MTYPVIGDVDYFYDVTGLKTKVTDAIGSTRGLWNEDGDRLGKYDYAPFGGKNRNTGEEITRKFTGHDWDNEARLYHTVYRQYSPDTGMWLTRDPLGKVDGPNVYAYVTNNPVCVFDALGQCGVQAQSSTLPGEEKGWQVSAALIDFVIAASGIIAFLAYSAHVWRKTSVGFAFAACAAMVILALGVIVASELATGASSQSDVLAMIMGAAAGAVCVGAAAATSTMYTESAVMTFRGVMGTVATRPAVYPWALGGAWAGGNVLQSMQSLYRRLLVF